MTIHPPYNITILHLTVLVVINASLCHPFVSTLGYMAVLPLLTWLLLNLKSLQHPDSVSVFWHVLPILPLHGGCKESCTFPSEKWHYKSLVCKILNEFHDWSCWMSATRQLVLYFNDSVIQAGIWIPRQVWVKIHRLHEIHNSCRAVCCSLSRGSDQERCTK